MIFPQTDHKQQHTKGNKAMNTTRTEKNPRSIVRKMRPALLALLIGLSIIFLFTALAIGLLISTRAQNQMQALQLAWLIMLPSVLLSGFMFPRDSMPLVMQAISVLVPATHFMEIIRGIVLRGATLLDLLPEVVALAVMGLLLLGLSALRFRKKIA